MSSLGLSLLILIVIAIGALAAYNFWLTRKPTARSDDFDGGFSSGTDPATRQEPSFSSGTTEPYLQQAQVADSAPGNPVASDAESVQTGLTAPTETLAPTETPAKWAAGVLPEAAPVSRPPDLNWKPDSAGVPDRSQPANEQSSLPPSFQGSIEQAMRLQREADELIDGELPAADVAQGADKLLSEPSEEIPSAVTPVESGLVLDPADESPSDSADQLSDLAPKAALDAAPEPAFDPTASAGGFADESEVRQPDLAEAGAQALPQDDLPESLPSTATPEAVAGGAAPANQLESLAPGWSGIDADRQAANFVATVNVELSGPTKGSELISATSKITHAGTKPVRITAGNPPAPGQTVIRTEPIDPARDYVLLRLELLQVNRHGPLSGVEYSSFVAAVDDLGESLGVLVNPPDMNVVLIRSRVLDAEIASLDAQVAVNVETEDPIAPERFVALTKEIGLLKVGAAEDGADETKETTLEESDQGGVYVARDEDDFVIYSAQLNPEANRIVLVLDVPTVPRQVQPVRKMVEGAWAFAQALNGRMIDDNGRAIDNALFERIESQIETHYQALLAAGVPAGSDLARQVYN